MAQEQKNVQEPDLNQLRMVRREKLAELQRAAETRLSSQNMTRHITVRRSKIILKELEGKKVSIAGRMMSKRVMGKASFCNVRILREISSHTWRETAWARRTIKSLKSWTWGDVVGVEGEVFRTKTGEMSIHASHVELLSRAFRSFLRSSTD